MSLDERARLPPPPPPQVALRLLIPLDETLESVLMLTGTEPDAAPLIDTS